MRFRDDVRKKECGADLRVCCVALCCFALCVRSTGEEEEEFPLVSKKQFDLFLRRFGPPERSLAKATLLLFFSSLLCATSLAICLTVCVCVCWCCRFVMCSRTERSASPSLSSLLCFSAAPATR
jgi:hypothetical protein